MEYNLEQIRFDVEQRIKELMEESKNGIVQKVARNLGCHEECINEILTEVGMLCFEEAKNEKVFFIPWIGTFYPDHEKQYIGLEPNWPSGWWEQNTDWQG